MSTYGNFIETTLKTEYISVNVLKNDECSKIEVFQHKSSNNKLVKILSKNRNDHIYRKLRGVKHENLPFIFDTCSCEEHIMILEEYIEGENLSDIMEKQQLTTNSAVSYILDVCNALDFLHKKNIIHRDVKPGNIIITPKKKAVLVDYSAARLMNDGQQKDTANLGTIGYAAPEQFGIYQSLPPTDIYALGVMFNEMLTKLHPSIKTPSGKLGKIIKKCTNIQITKRYQSVDDLICDIKRYQKFHN